MSDTTPRGPRVNHQPFVSEWLSENGLTVQPLRGPLIDPRQLRLWPRGQPWLRLWFPNRGVTFDSISMA